MPCSLPERRLDAALLTSDRCPACHWHVSCDERHGCWTCADAEQTRISRRDRRLCRGRPVAARLRAGGRPQRHRDGRDARLDRRHRTRRAARRARRPEQGLRQDAARGDQTATCRCSCRPAPMSCPICRCPAACGFPACPARRASSMAATAISSWPNTPTISNSAAWSSTAQTAGWATMRRGCSICAGVGHLVIDNCQIIGSGKNGLALEHAAGRIERSDHIGRRRCRHLFGRGDRTGDHRQHASPTAPMAASSCIAGSAAEDGTMVTGNRVERIGARSGGTGQNGNGINALPRRQRHHRRAMSSPIAPSRRSAPTAPATCRSPATPARAAARRRSIPNSAFEGAMISNNIVDGAANGISIVNFNEGGRMARLLRQHRAQPRRPAAPTRPIRRASASASASRPTWPCPATSSRTRRSIGMQIGWGPYLRNVVATGNVIRKAGTGIAVTRSRGRRLGGHLRQRHRRRAERRRRRPALGGTGDRRPRPS